MTEADRVASTPRADSPSKQATNILEFKPIKRDREDMPIEGHLAARLAAAGFLDRYKAERRARREARRREPLTETAKNLRERERRADDWRKAERATRYWDLKKDYDDAWINAADDGIVAAPKPGDVDTRDANVRKWRQAQLAQMLTPAPTVAAVTWKRHAFASGQWQHIGADRKKIERAIEFDAAWLAAHPSRRPKAKSDDESSGSPMDDAS